jgi:hypothetical protein
VQFAACAKAAEDPEQAIMKASPAKIRPREP